MIKYGLQCLCHIIVNKKLKKIHVCVMDKRVSFFTFVSSRTLNGDSVHHTLEKKKHIYRVLNGVYNFVRVCPDYKRGIASMIDFMCSM